MLFHFHKLKHLNINLEQWLQRTQFPWNYFSHLWKYFKSIFWNEKENNNNKWIILVDPMTWVFLQRKSKRGIEKKQIHRTGISRCLIMIDRDFKFDSILNCIILLASFYFGAASHWFKMIWLKCKHNHIGLFTNHTCINFIVFYFIFYIKPHYYFPFIFDRSVIYIFLFCS